jgi:electron transfer flavoprotein alpha subunit
MTVLAVAEHRRGELRAVSFELATAGRTLADALGTDLHVAVVGGDVERYADSLDVEGVDVVHTVDYGEEFNHDVYVQVLEELAGTVDPGVLLAPHTVNGLDYAPALAERLGYPLVTDAVDLAVDDGVVVTREMYGSKVETTIEVADDRALVTLRSTEWPAAGGVGDAERRSAAVTVDESAVQSTVKGFEEAATGDVDITEADVLVSVGRGIDEEENLDLAFDLADALDATVSGSRPIVDNGWLPANRQVGQSGKVVTPDVYIAIGISGAVQHVAGMKGAETIVAINNDPNAPIYDIADYGIVDDLFDVVPPLVEEFS